MQDLIKRIEAASGPDREINAEILLMIGGKKRGMDWWIEFAYIGRAIPAYTASIDAAMTLVPEGEIWAIDYLRSPKTVARVGAFNQGSAATPALALCAAALKARQQEQEG